MRWVENKLVQTVAQPWNLEPRLLPSIRSSASQASGSVGGVARCIHSTVGGGGARASEQARFGVASCEVPGEGREQTSSGL